MLERREFLIRAVAHGEGLGDGGLRRRRAGTEGSRGRRAGQEAPESIHDEPFIELK
jgi:hypothetical protein